MENNTAEGDKHTFEEDIMDTTLIPAKKGENKIKIEKATNLKKISSKSKEKKSYPKLSYSGKSKTIKCDFCGKEMEKEIMKNHKESHPSKIFDWLYLGSYNNALNKKELQFANIKYILNCARECKNLFESDFKYKHFNLSVKIEKIYNT